MDAAAVMLVWVVAITGVPFFSDAAVLFSCSFRRNSCGMENQPGLKALWNRTYLRLAGRRGYAVAVKGNDSGDQFARYLTPRFETGGAEKGCLSFSYFIDGRTPASLAGIQQGHVTRYVFATARKTQDHWARAELDVDFAGDQVMFYFEADTKVQEFGNSLVAFSDLQVTDRPCDRRANRRRRRRH